jgi:hypothetical protein
MLLNDLAFQNLDAFFKHGIPALGQRLDCRCGVDVRLDAVADELPSVRVGIALGASSGEVSLCQSDDKRLDFDLVEGYRVIFCRGNPSPRHVETSATSSPRLCGLATANSCSRNGKFILRSRGGTFQC